MPISTTSITGKIYLPNGSVPSNGRVVFELTSWDRQEGEAVFVTGPYIAEISETGDVSIELFTTTEGTNSVTYRMSVVYRDPVLHDHVFNNTKTDYIGFFALSGPGPFRVSELEITSEYIPTSFDLYAEIKAYQAAINIQVDSVAQNLTDTIAVRDAALAAATYTSQSIADMQALTTPLNGDKVIVIGGDDYVYDATSSLTADGKLVVTATGMGVGQWISTQTTYADWDALDTDQRSLDAGVVVHVRSIDYYYTVVESDEDFTTTGGNKFTIIKKDTGLDPRAIGSPADGITDDAPFVEAAYLITDHVNLASDQTYLFASVIGLPDQTFYTDRMFILSGTGAKVVLDGVSAGDAIFTSAAAKLTPEGTTDLYTGKFNVVSGINFTQTSSSVLLNGDRIYNTFVDGNHFYGITSISKSYRNKGAGKTNGYIQSLSLTNNHFVSVAKIVDAKRIFNFHWEHNKAEGCGAGIYADGNDDAAVVTFSMGGGHFEGGGLPVRLGKVLSGSVKDMYFEANTGGDIATDKCAILIGVGGGRSQAFLIENVSFQPTEAQRADADYVSIKDGAPATDNGILSVKSCYTTGTRLFVPGQVRHQSGNGIGNGSTAALWASRAPIQAHFAGVSAVSAATSKTLASVNAAGTIQVASLNVSDILTYLGSKSWEAASSGTIHVDMRITTSGGVQTGAAAADIAFIVAPAAAGISSGETDDIYAAFELVSFVQIAAGASIETTFSNVTRAHFTSPTLSVARVDNVYEISLTGFAAGSSLSNYGAATNILSAVTTYVNGRRVSTSVRSPNVFPSGPST